MQLLRLTGNKNVERWPSSESKRLSLFIVQMVGSSVSKLLSKFEVETTEQNLMKGIFILFATFMKRRLTTEEKQVKVNVVREGIERGCESESREVW